MVTISLVLLIAAFILFAIEAWRKKSIVAEGLGCWVLSELVGHVLLH